jgi:hypothetical protein
VNDPRPNALLLVVDDNLSRELDDTFLHIPPRWGDHEVTTPRHRRTRDEHATIWRSVRPFLLTLRMSFALSSPTTPRKHQPRDDSAFWCILDRHTAAMQLHDLPHDTEP